MRGPHDIPRVPNGIEEVNERDDAAKLRKRGAEVLGAEGVDSEVLGNRVRQHVRGCPRDKASARMANKHDALTVLESIATKPREILRVVVDRDMRVVFEADQF
jgi:hypothetical protein